MEPREQRGLIIAAVCKIIGKRDTWFVPSQSNAKETYTVNTRHACCTCPDHKEGGFKCKHQYAVEFMLKREFNRNGMIETKSITITEKKACKQAACWDHAQMTEKHRFQELLFDLCQMIPEPPRAKTGRPRVPLADQVFSCVYKVYSTFSSRRFACDLKDAFEKGYISHLMHSVSTCAYLENERMTPVLKDMIVKSSLPLRAVETVFAPDSTGFSVSRFVRWHDEKYGMRSGKDWVKAHAMVGVKTNVVTAVEILDRDAADSPQFKPMLETTAKNFAVKEVAADKAYLSHENLALTEWCGGEAFIPYKINSQQGEAGSLWEKMYLYYNFKREEFAKHYHQRSNAESTFSMLKAKFGDGVRSKTDVAKRNECLAKFVCHNICCVHQSQIELGVEPIFWGEKPEGERLNILSMIARD